MLNKLFGNRKLNAINAFEKKFQITYPNQLKEKIKATELKFRLPDEDYKILNSLLQNDVENKLEDVNYLIEHLNTGKLKSHFKKVPFARNQRAGKDKYLVFENETNNVYLTDNNGIINQLELSNLVDIFLTKKSLKLTETEKHKLPIGIKYIEDSYGQQQLEKSAPDNDLIAESYGVYYSTKERTNNNAKLEIQCTLKTQNTQHNFSTAYKLQNPELDSPLKHMLEYRMYYYNLHCLIHCLGTFVNKMTNSEDLKPIIDQFNLYETAKNMLRGNSVEKI